jgi:hypothetical protein
MATVMIRCVDARYSKAGVRQVLPEAYDFTCPGAALGVVEDTACYANILTQWQKLTALGLPIDKIVIVDHCDTEGKHGCKAYENNDSRERHESNLYTAAELIQKNPDFANIPIELYLHDIDTGKVEKIDKKNPRST